MGNEMTLFDFDGTEIRTLGEDSVWFVAQDVARVLEYSRERDMYRLLADDEKGAHIVRTLGGPQKMATLNEPGLYRAVFSSRSAKAENFRRWVFHDVLPTLRQQGHVALAGGALDRQLQECSVGYATLMAAFGKRSAPTDLEWRVMRGFSEAMEAAGLPPQYQGVAPDPEQYRLTPALARVLVEAYGVGKPTTKVERARVCLA